MKFTVRDRILLIGMLPPQGDFRTIKLLRKLREALAFTEIENKDFKIVSSPNGQVTWDGEKGSAGKEVLVGDVMFEVIVGLLKDMDEKKALTENHVDLYEMFIMAGQPADEHGPSIPGEARPDEKS
jgi:hypothetical protein